MNVVISRKTSTITYKKVVKVLVTDDELRFTNVEDDEVLIYLNDTDIDFICIDKCR